VTRRCWRAEAVARDTEMLDLVLKSLRLGDSIRVNSRCDVAPMTGGKWEVITPDSERSFTDPREALRFAMRAESESIPHPEMKSALASAGWRYHVTRDRWHKPDKSTATMTTEEAYAALRAEQEPRS
jgi:hypothetical protein